MNCTPPTNNNLRFLFVIDLVKLSPLFINSMLNQFAGTMHVDMKVLVQFDNVGCRKFCHLR